ncbi:Rrf2 family transcriptional regulator [Allohahella sp. A8]|uniref:Rrf2 family transcriptional regulator n=1 Tax=Allohahella sp. A8 TaxID=3141461 RepID=UPI003A8037AB
MRITRYTDYSLRVLVYLAVKPGRLATIQEIAESYNISRNHLMKVVHQLTRAGYVTSIRGKNGGLRLGRAASDINIGALMRETEPDMGLVECFRTDNQCCITPACGLKYMLAEALQNFLETLDKYTLQDVLPGESAHTLIDLLQIAD